MNFIKKIFNDGLLKKLLKNASVLLSGNIVSQVIGMITLVFSTRLLGPELFGVLVVIQTYILIVDSIVNFQSWQALIKFGVEALEKTDQEKFKGYIKFGTILDVSTAIIATLIAIVSIQFVGPLVLGLNSEQTLMASVYSLTILFHLSGTPTAVLRIYNKFKMFAYQQVISALIRLIGIIIATLIGADLWAVLMVWMLSEVVGHIILLVLGHLVLHTKDIRKWWSSPIVNGKEIFKFTCWTNLTSMLDVPVKQLDIIMVSTVISFEAVSIYKVFKQVSNVIGKVADPIFQAIYPQLVQLITAKKYKRSLKFSLKSGFIISAILTPIIIIIVSLSPIWLDILFGELYASAWHILAIYLTLRLLSVAFICIHPLFIAMGLVKKNVLILFFTNLIYIGAALLLGAVYGLLGIVLAYGIQFLSVVIWKLYYIFKDIQEKNNYVFEHLK
ncbi:lipopolysaccharide biosynthesis protein [Oceanobacillus sp. AG]|uniref:lipopolysaccharide biosynthesis protein n=1 Tax=Oceanobacillus sp. AG TaxID=2681969 RepID=UPI0012EBC4AD|nr:oligosaccharide flippase family protein [Oceanobacillus sp. AG]